jgi:hypothetical protein
LQRETAVFDFTKQVFNQVFAGSLKEGWRRLADGPPGRPRIAFHSVSPFFEAFEYLTKKTACRNEEFAGNGSNPSRQARKVKPAEEDRRVYDRNPSIR